MDGERRLSRSEEGRLITGVCAGLGRYTRIDPLVFRVGFALLVLTTGVGLILYVGAFLLMAAPDGGPSAIERMGHRVFDGDTVLTLLGLGLGVGVVLGALGGWRSGDGLAVVVVFALALFVARSRGVDLAQAVRGLPERVRRHPPETPPPRRDSATPGRDAWVDLALLSDQTPPGAAGGTVPVPAPPARSWHRLGGRRTPRGQDDRVPEPGPDAHDHHVSELGQPVQDHYVPEPGPTVQDHPGPEPGSAVQDPPGPGSAVRDHVPGAGRTVEDRMPGSGTVPDHMPGSGRTVQDRVPRAGRWGAPPAEAPPGDPTRPLFSDLPGQIPAAEVYVSEGRRRSYLTSFTLVLAALAAAGLLVWTGGRPTFERVQIVVGGMLAVILIGLLAASWFGRNRGLVIVGVLMSLVLASASVAGDPALAAKAHHVTWRPATAGQVEHVHRVLIGAGTVDLTRTAVAPGQRLRVSAQVTLGTLTVRVPAAARVEVDGHALLGDITVDRQVTSGPGARVRRVLEPEGGDGSPSPVIELRIRGRVGDLEVTRVPT